MELASKYDVDQRTLRDMLRDRLAPRTLLAITGSAYHPGIFELMLKAAQLRRRHPARAIIVPINMRCFSPQWDLHPQWQLDYQQRAIRNFLRRARIDSIPDLTISDRSKSRYEAISVKLPLSDHKRIGDFVRAVRLNPTNEEERCARIRNLLIFHYGSVLRPDHRKLKALSSAIGIAHQIAPRVLVYVTPINFGAARRYGPELVDVVAENIAVVEETVGDIADWSAALSEDYFFSRDETTEHLNETGRQALTELIAGQI